MTREGVRAGFTQAIEALRLAYPTPLNVEYPNQVELDPAAQTDPFMKVRIVYNDSYQASLGPRKHLRAVGMLLLECWVNPGKGTKLANDMVQHFYPSLHMSDSIAGVRTLAVKFLPNQTRAGWDVQPIGIPFWFDEVA